MNLKTEFERFAASYPLQTKVIDGVPFRYRLGGLGETAVVLLVGGLGLCDVFYRQFEAFAGSYTVLTLDYPVDIRCNGQLADGIARLIAELGLGKAYLIGQSYGGLIAQVIAGRHPEVTAGLVLSNTGCLSAQMDAAAKQTMLDMTKGMERTIKLLKLIPMFVLRRIFLQRMEKHFRSCTAQERQYLLELSRLMFAALTKRGELHMCYLMMDLAHHTTYGKGDFAYLQGRVLLLLSHDDETFAEGVKAALIDLMPHPMVRTDLSGGHLALMLHIDTYVQTVRAFIDSGV